MVRLQLHKNMQGDTMNKHAWHTPATAKSRSTRLQPATPATRVGRTVRAVVMSLLTGLTACGGGGDAGTSRAAAPPATQVLPAFITGEGPPPDTLGRDDQFYLDVAAVPKQLYGPRENGRWPAGIRGPGLGLTYIIALQGVYPSKDRA